MIRPALLAVAVAASGLVSACGFQPAYAPVSEGSSALRIGEIEGRTGHYLRQDLVRSLGRGVPGAANAGQLDIQVKESINYVGFRPDQASSRADYVAVANWSLVSTTGEVITSGVTSEVASFNFAGLPYNDLTAQTAAQERVALALARSIRQEIILKAGHKAAPKTP